MSLASHATDSWNDAHEPLWSPLGPVGPLKARVSGNLPQPISGISIDTRTLAPGDLFFAIKGEKTDGHDHVVEAFAKGAAAAVVDEDHAEALKDSGPLYVVKSVLSSLEGLGAAARARSAARVTAVTGSAGKTTTKEALRLVLSHAGRVHASPASYNNHWGVPLTLARMPRDTRFAVIEIGMNHAGEITPLVGLARPHIAIVTNVGPVHLEFFDSVEAIADAKAEIFSGLVPGGIAILNRDNDHYERLTAAARLSQAGHIATFGAHERADARLLGLQLTENDMIVEARIADRDVTYRINAPGRHLALDSLAVLLAARALGLDLDQASTAFAEFEVPAGRGRRFELGAKDGPFTLIDESYNANPASIRAALEMLGTLRGRRIAVLGDMRELGARGSELHAELAADVAANRIDLVFAAGPLMKYLFDALPEAVRGGWRESAGALEEMIAAEIRSGDVVLIKGSNASRMQDIVASLRSRFADEAHAE
ncbi:MAG TPA: UDP-N-acetylmuramoylalanyl-D-glutamyl-2,6-diaminopimelate--D-alanyl-D-alanine ligase [Methylovirgula sp.]|nr:UDP-N-acetylmuramoylalanyl-D-glutamyl-2,6-diaminopimelate--D-alanyl-D-alanine ligase [Methylovirgula sp.]